MVRTPPTESSSVDDGDAFVVDSAPTKKDPASIAAPSSRVLAAALAEADGLSYSFDMGMDMNMNMLGMSMVMAPEGPVMTGSVSGDRMYAVMDMGALMAGMSVTDDQGNLVPMAEMEEFGGMRYEMWIDGSIMTIDMSDMATLDPTVSGAAAEGAVSFDLNDLSEGFGVTDVTTDMMSAADMYPGMGSMDPTAVAELLRGLDEVSESGMSEVGGRDVIVYSGSLSMSDYAEAMGEDVMGELDDLGSFGDSEQIISALETLAVEMTLMIDDDDLLRRLEIYMDMGPMFEAMFATDTLAAGAAEAPPTDEEEFGAAIEDAFEAMFADMNVTIDMWMEFDGYGESFDFDPPAAVDLTDDADVFFGDSVAA